MDTENNPVEQLTNGTTCGKLEKVARFFDERADTWDSSSHVGEKPYARRRSFACGRQAG